MDVKELILEFKSNIKMPKLLYDSLNKNREPQTENRERLRYI